MLGSNVGSLVGSNVGSILGSVVGSLVGALVGYVGDTDGASVSDGGDVVGLDVGLEGIAVGAGVGLLVGAGDGAYVSSNMLSYSQGLESRWFQLLLDKVTYIDLKVITHKTNENKVGETNHNKTRRKLNIVFFKPT